MALEVEILELDNAEVIEEDTAGLALEEVPALASDDVGDGGEGVGTVWRSPECSTNDILRGRRKGGGFTLPQFKCGSEIGFAGLTCNSAR
jgi:hypothetical protein